jgi:hypothetical protein
VNGGWVIPPLATIKVVRSEKLEEKAAKEGIVFKEE